MVFLREKAESAEFDLNMGKNGIREESEFFMIETCFLFISLLRYWGEGNRRDAGDY